MGDDLIPEPCIVTDVTATAAWGLALQSDRAEHREMVGPQLGVGASAGRKSWQVTGAAAGRTLCVEGCSLSWWVEKPLLCHVVATLHGVSCGHDVGSGLGLRRWVGL